jgi:hypothetical protein
VGTADDGGRRTHALHRAIIAVLAALMVVQCAPAAAATGYDRYNALADQIWPGRCAGQARVVQVDRIANDDSILGSADGLWDGTCTYTVRRDLTEYEACVTTVHERGHLNGYRPTNPFVDALGHADPWHDRRGIMAPHPVDEFPDYSYLPCARLANPPLSRDQARDYVEVRWAVRSLECRAVERARRLCYGTSAGGKRVRWDVFFDDQYRVRALRR